MSDETKCPKCDTLVYLKDWGNAGKCTQEVDGDAIHGAERCMVQQLHNLITRLQSENNRLRECCEALLPFALHAKAHGIHKGDHNLRTPILSHGSSRVTVGAFQSAYEAAVESGLLKETGT